MSKTNDSVAKDEGDVKDAKSVNVVAVRDMDGRHVQRVVLNKHRLASLGLKWVEEQGFDVVGGAWERGPELVLDVEMDASMEMPK